MYRRVHQGHRGVHQYRAGQQQESPHQAGDCADSWHLRSSHMGPGWKCDPLFCIPSCDLIRNSCTLPDLLQLLLLSMLGAAVLHRNALESAARMLRSDLEQTRSLSGVACLFMRKLPQQSAAAGHRMSVPVSGRLTDCPACRHLGRESHLAIVHHKRCAAVLGGQWHHPHHLPAQLPGHRGLHQMAPPALISYAQHAAAGRQY